MNPIKTKTLERIEEKMEYADDNSMRYRMLKCAKDFKTSWIELGQTLYSVWKDKLYKEWGYNQFDSYTTKEIGIRKQTAMKLLKSYYFLEKEEPSYLTKEHNQEANTSSIPTYQSVDVLRLANKKKTLDRVDYAQFKKKILQGGRDASQAKRDLTQLIREREELGPEEVWQKKRITLLKRFLSTLRSIKMELKTTKLLPAQIVKDTEKLINRLETEIS